MSDSKQAAFPVTLPRQAPRGLNMLMLVFVLVGGVAFYMGLQSDPARAWRAYLVSVIFFTGLSLAGVVWGAVTRLANGRFARPVLRIMEGLGAFQFVSFFLIVIFLLFGARHVYPWIHEVYKPVPWWLTLQNVTVRDIGSLAVLMGVNLFFMRNSLKPDVAALQSKVPANLQGMYKGWARGFGSSDVELERHRKMMMRTAPAVIMLYAVVWSLIAFDLIMSLDMEFSSSMFGGIMFMGSFLGAIACTAIISTFVRSHWKLEEVIAPGTLHDLGKLTFALSVFWAYVNWSQFLPIWYANYTDEQHWMYIRMNDTWRPWTFAAIILTWAIPFFLMMTLAAKRNPATLRMFAIIVLAGLWLERFVTIVPSISPNTVPFGITEMATALGFFGLFSVCYLWYLNTFPVLPVADPYQAAGTTN